MSKERNNKQPYGFVLVATGLLIGFFLGAGIVYWYSNQPADYLITDHALEKIARIFKSAGPEDRNEKSRKKGPGTGTQKPRQQQQPIPELTSSVEETGSMQADSTDVADEFKELFANAEEALADSLYSDSLDIFTAIAIEEDINESPAASTRERIQIRKDRLVGIRSYVITPTEPADNRSQGSQILDSLIGGRPATGHQKRTLYVEFWESPLNYTAYKMGRNRVILYGFDQIDLISILYHEEGLYMKYYLNYFDLQYTADFKPLIPVSNPDLITKLEQQWP